MRTIKSRTLAIALMTVALAGCKPNVVTTPGMPRDEKLIQLTLACARVQEGVRFALEAKRALLADKKISKATSSEWTGILKKVTQANNELNDRSMKFDTFTAGKDDLFKLFDQLLQAYKSLEAKGTLPGSPEFDKALSLISAGVTAAKQIFQ